MNPHGSINHLAEIGRGGQFLAIAEHGINARRDDMGAISDLADKVLGHAKGFKSFSSQ